MFEKIKRIFYRGANLKYANYVHEMEKEINYKTMQKMLKQNDCILIDVRSEQEYKEEHFDGAISIPLYDLSKQILKIVPDKNAKIIVYCSSGLRSKQAQEILKQMEYENVFNLQGGMNNI